MGETWAELSDGKCRFVMATDKKWGGIEAMLNALLGIKFPAGR